MYNVQPMVPKRQPCRLCAKNDIRISLHKGISQYCTVPTFFVIHRIARNGNTSFRLSGNFTANLTTWSPCMKAVLSVFFFTEIIYS